MLRLHEGERIVAVVPEYASGPGWSNTPLWVYVRDLSGVIREFAIQPQEQTLEMLLLFKILEAAHTAMRDAVWEMQWFERRKEE